MRTDVHVGEELRLTLKFPAEAGGRLRARVVVVWRNTQTRANGSLATDRLRGVVRRDRDAAATDGVRSAQSKRVTGGRGAARRNRLKCKLLFLYSLAPVGGAAGVKKCRAAKQWRQTPGEGVRLSQAHPGRCQAPPSCVARDYLERYDAGLGFGSVFWLPPASATPGAATTTVPILRTASSFFPRFTSLTGLTGAPGLLPRLALRLSIG